MPPALTLTSAYFGILVQIFVAAYLTACFACILRAKARGPAFWKRSIRLLVRFAMSVIYVVVQLKLSPMCLSVHNFLIFLPFKTLHVVGAFRSGLDCRKLRASVNWRNAPTTARNATFRGLFRWLRRRFDWFVWRRVWAPIYVTFGGNAVAPCGLATPY